MGAYVLPDLTLPFASASHPQALRVQEATEAWCRRFGLLRSPAAAAKFHALGYGRLMATLCPRVAFDRLALVVDWNSFFFIADDQQNAAVTTNRTVLYEEIVAGMRRIIAGEAAPDPSHPLFDALGDLLGRSLPGRPAAWTARFRRNLDLWLTGHLAEDVYRMAGSVPTVADYIAVRRDASTVLPTLDLVEMAEDAAIPEALYRTPEYQTLVLGTADIMCWINDIHSLPMEADDPINLVTVLDHHHGLGVQGAIDAVAAHIAARVEEHLAASRALPAVMDGLGLAPEAQAAIRRCVEDQQSWAAGMERWDRLDTIRFAAVEVPARGHAASYVEDLLG